MDWNSPHWPTDTDASKRSCEPVQLQVIFQDQAAKEAPLKAPGARFLCFFCCCFFFGGKMTKKKNDQLEESSGDPAGKNSLRTQIYWSDLKYASGKASDFEYFEDHWELKVIIFTGYRISEDICVALAGATKFGFNTSSVGIQACWDLEVFKKKFLLGSFVDVSSKGGRSEIHESQGVIRSYRRSSLRNSCFLISLSQPQKKSDKCSVTEAV